MRVSVQIGDELAPALEAEAKAMDMKPSRWIEALLRRRVLGRPVLRRQDELAFIEVQVELRAIGVRVSQVLWDLERTPGPSAERQLEQLSELRAEIRRHLARLRAAFEGDLAYWET
ncbi:hypothetical protein [Phenylobacterium sp.]|uniref:hypothetical protein n=1 Tax=Phenylobacterium sp. TaxID=1871053 RepID=UPI003BA924CF